MSLYLNNDNRKFLEYINNEIYVDKSLLIKATNDSLGKKSKYRLTRLHYLLL